MNKLSISVTIFWEHHLDMNYSYSKQQNGWFSSYLHKNDVEIGD